MFASLKNKIKEETGSEVAGPGVVNMPQLQPHQLTAMNHTANNNNNNNNRLKSRFSSTISVNSNDESLQSESLITLRQQCQELSAKASELQNRISQLQEEKLRVEKTNEILLETVKVAQTQKDIYCEEQEKIQNMQQNEIDKLRSLLSFREQEAVDRLNAMRQHQTQVENLTSELERFKHYETEVEDLKDELQQLRHSSQQDKNNLTTTLAAIEEENRHLKMRLQIVEKARIESLSTLSGDDKLQALVHERKLLEQHLEEAHLQLSDIKSSWSGQNLALETQVSRLSKQVAEETTEKRKILKTKDDLIERVKHVEFELLKAKDEIKQRDDKIKLLEEEIDELNLALKECREENEQQIVYERNKSASLEAENLDLKNRLEAADERFGNYAADAANVSQTLRQQLNEIQQQLNDTQLLLENEKEEKLTALLKNAEISQSEELLKKELRDERDEANEIHEKNATLEGQLKTKQLEILECKQQLEEMQRKVEESKTKIKECDELQSDITEKNKTIKVLNQRLTDLKKTLQKEFSSAKSLEEFSENQKTTTSSTTTTTTPAIIATTTTYSNDNTKLCQNCGCLIKNSIIMDEVNFKYLKHVIVKFLTSREVEARHLIRAVATLLKLTKEEEKLLHDTLNWKMSWFGSKPNHGSGQRAFSIPPTS
ncbi:golgin subfamily A member 1 [Lucilia cuprina]|uniref:golgin subfamily A member 1 n=1 Tax=Lucilia cuprina TaxID=7375 RepID=UPI001F06AD5A|nr:golgin subfamily A member 1 [Lucilia cuprina]